MLRSEVCFLDKIHVPVIPLVISSFMQPLTRPPSFIFNLFSKDDEVHTVGAKKGREMEEQADSNKEFRKSFKKASIESRI